MKKAVVFKIVHETAKEGEFVIFGWKDRIGVLGPKVLGRAKGGGFRCIYNLNGTFETITDDFNKVTAIYKELNWFQKLFL